MPSQTKDPKQPSNRRLKNRSHAKTETTTKNLRHINTTHQQRENVMTAAASLSEDTTRSVNINLRAPVKVKELIDRAADIVGKTRTEFMLDSARRYAEDVLLDQSLFQLDEDKFKAFINLLDEAPKPKPELKKLLATKAPWETGPRAIRK